MKQFIRCFLTAGLASGFTLWLSAPPDGSSAIAQVRQTPQVPPALPGQLPKVYDRDGLTPDEAVSVYVYEKNNRSVANIMTRTPRQGFLVRDEEGSGSGCVLDKAGHILTNYHVIEGAREIRVTLFDGETYEAETIGADPINDTAVIRIRNAPAEVLFPPQIGDSGKLKVGMKVFAIGNPFGYERTLSTGVISSLNRSLQVTEARSIKSIIQIDAAINPGNSGGPLFDSHGRLIGMNTAIATRTGQSAGIGFAIPMNLVRRIVPQLIQNGRVVRADIGILRVYETNEGLLIKTLDPRGPAARAGLRGPQLVEYRRGPFVIEGIDRTAADLIVGVDSTATKTTEDFLSYIDKKKPGDEVMVRIVREGRTLKVPVVLGD